MELRAIALATIGLALSGCGGSPDALAKDAVVDLCIGDPGATEAFCDCAAEIATGMLSEDELHVYGELYKREQERGGMGIALYSQYAEELGYEESQLRTIWRSANAKVMQSPARANQECAGL